MPLNVCEIFYSLQGESTFAGLPCIFIRLSGCNLNCSWCDTPYASEESTRLSFEDIFEKIEPFDCNLVEITGGEPLLQPETPALVSELIQKRYKVLIETNGSQSIRDLDPDCIKIVDIKCPSSGESGSFLDKNIDLLSPQDEIKFVIADRKDYEFAAALIKTRLTRIPPEKIHLSPVWNEITPATISEWMMQDHIGARLSLQQHKIIWDPEKRGV